MIGSYNSCLWDGNTTLLSGSFNTVNCTCNSSIIGGKLKSKQMISGNMADILSNLYLGYSLLWYHDNYAKTNLLLRDECLIYLLNDLDYKMNIVIENYPIYFFKPFLYPLKNKLSYQVFENKNKLYSFIINNNELHEIFKNDIYYKNTVLEKMEKLKQMDPNTLEYKSLYQDIISVGEISI
jgi:hypothetical protein